MAKAWVIRIKNRQRKLAANELGIVIKPRHIFVTFDKFCDVYGTKRYAEFFETKREAEDSIEHDFEEVVAI